MILSRWRLNLFRYYTSRHSLVVITRLGRVSLDLLDTNMRSIQSYLTGLSRWMLDLLQLPHIAGTNLLQCHLTLLSSTNHSQPGATPKCSNGYSVFPRPCSNRVGPMWNFLSSLSPICQGRVGVHLWSLWCFRLQTKSYPCDQHCLAQDYVGNRYTVFVPQVEQSSTYWSPCHPFVDLAMSSSLYSDTQRLLITGWPLFVALRTGFFNTAA